MAKRASLSVSLTPHQADFVTNCVASGRWQTTSEVVRAALQLLEHQESLKQAEIERARALIQEGAAQLDLGKTLTDEQFFREWDEELADLERPRTA